MYSNVDFNITLLIVGYTFQFKIDPHEFFRSHELLIFHGNQITAIFILLYVTYVAVYDT